MLGHPWLRSTAKQARCDADSISPSPCPRVRPLAPWSGDGCAVLGLRDETLAPACIGQGPIGQRRICTRTHTCPCLRKSHPLGITLAICGTFFTRCLPPLPICKTSFRIDAPLAFGNPLLI